jgi:hypothetical protein
MPDSWDAFPDASAPAATEAPSWNDFPDAHQDSVSPGAILGLATQRMLEAQPGSDVAKARQIPNRILYGVNRWPGIGKALGAAHDFTVMQSANRIKEDKADETDYLKVANFIASQQEHQNQSFGQSVADVVTALPAFGIEMGLTGGFYGAGKAAATKAMGAAARTAVGKAAGFAAGAATGVAAQTLAHPQMVAQNTAARMMPPLQPGVNAKGDIENIKVGEGDDFLAALPPAFLDSAIEIGSERAGGYLVAPLAKIPGVARLAAIKQAVVNRWLSAVPGRTPQMFNEFFHQVGWHGLLPEVLEERFGDVSRLATGLESPDQNVTGQAGSAGFHAATGNPEKAKNYASQALQQLAVEGLAFSVPGAANVGLSRLGQTSQPSARDDREFQDRMNAVEKQYRESQQNRAASSGYNQRDDAAEGDLFPPGEKARRQAASAEQQQVADFQAHTDASDAFSDRMHGLAQQQLQPGQQPPPHIPMPWERDAHLEDQQVNNGLEAQQQAEKSKNDQAAQELADQEREMYRAFYSSPEAAANYSQRFPEQAKQLAGLKSYHAEDFQKVDPDLPVLTGTPQDATARRQWKQWVGQFLADPASAELAVQAHQQSQLPQNQRDPRQWQKVPEGVEIPANPAIEVKETAGGRFVRFRTGQPQAPVNDTVSSKPDQQGVAETAIGELDVIPSPAELDDHDLETDVRALGGILLDMDPSDPDYADLETRLKTAEDAIRKRPWLPQPEQTNASPIRGNQGQTGEQGNATVGGQEPRSPNLQFQPQVEPSGPAQRPAEAVNPAEEAVSPHGGVVGKIGVNAKGQKLYQDDRGVRYRLEDGIRITEPVEMIPTRAGIQTSVGHRSDEWLTTEEKPEPAKPPLRKLGDKKQPEPPATGAVGPDEQLARWVTDRLRTTQPGPLTDDEFFTAAASTYGGSRAEGKYGDSQAYDALERGVNAALLGNTDPTVDAAKASEIVAKLEELSANLPRHKTRTGNKDTLQQFSTPPAYAFVSVWVANPTAHDVILEPSAGTGGLAAHAINSGAKVYANEIDPARASLLSGLPLAGVFKGGRRAYRRDPE